MGKKKTEEVPKEEPKKDDTNHKEEEDEPLIKELKELDDKYLAIEKEYEKAVQELQKQFTQKQQPFLDARTKVLANLEAATNEAKDKGTPALLGFWKQAMKHLPALEDHVEEWDEPVLEYCSDVTKSWIDDTDLSKGFKLQFHFVENPYFTNTELCKEYYVKEENPYTGEMTAKEIKATTIDWKPGKDVTVEKVTKKVKGGGAKKAKQKGKEKEEPRDSFFRGFFRNLKEGGTIPEDINLEEARELVDDDDDDDDEHMLELLMENDYEIGCCVRDSLVPFAVRWYTGEACPEGYDEDDDEEEESEEEDDDEDDDEDEDEPPKGKKYHPPGRGKAGKGGAGEPKEECKQQ